MGENFEIYLSYLAKMHSICPPWLEKILKYTCLNWLKMRSNYPPWMEKNLKCTYLNCLKMKSNCPPRLKEILKYITDLK